MRSLVLVSMLGLAGCGRIAFDLLPDDGPMACSPWSTPASLTALNVAGQDEFGAAPSPDGLELVFHSSRVGSGGADLYTATRATRTAAFGNVTQLSNLNSGFDEENPTFSPDGLTLIFASDRSGVFLLYRTTRSAAGAAWDAPTIVNELAAVTLQGPTLSKQGTELYASQGANATLQLLKSTYDGLTFSNPTSIAEFNDGLPRGYAGISPDGLTLVYEGQRTAYETSYVTRPALGMPWGPEAKFTEVDDGNKNGDPEWSYDGTELYFSSNRLDVAGNTFDMFVITRSCQ